MDTAIILATGQSQNQDDVDYCRGKGIVIAVSDCYKLAPWADALCSHDQKWWARHPGALEFEGRKFCRFTQNKTERFSPSGMPIGCNSGLFAMYVARDIFKAKRIFLLGFDMWGTHYFGKHPEGLRNTTENRFKAHIRMFDRFSGADVINCTKGSALKKYPFADIREVI